MERKSFSYTWRRLKSNRRQKWTLSAENGRSKAGGKWRAQDDMRAKEVEREKHEAKVKEDRLYAARMADQRVHFHMFRNHINHV